jgi:competence protein ComEA
VEPRTLAALCVVLVIALGFAVHHYLSGRPQSVTAERTAPAARAASLEPAPAPSAGAPPHPPPAGTVGSGAIGGQRLVIDIAGEVAEPGVRTMPPGSRVTDAIEAAGGVAPGTETEGINRARLLIDGEHLLIGGEQPGPPPGPGAAPGRGTGAVLADGRVGINAATVQELEQLPGVGPVLAGNIASYRDQQGGFTAVEQLLSVPGIGPARLSQLRDRVVL